MIHFPQMNTPRSFMRTASPTFGHSYTGATREVIAVAFSTDQVNTRFIPPVGFHYDADVFTLPNLRGYGQLPDLWVAMSLDPVLKTMVQANDNDLQNSGACAA
jgi:hypothetical protein